MAPRVVRVSHSPDSDDAFMFWALAEEKLDTGDLRYVHELADIETLNRRALAGELEVSAVSIHAYAYLCDRYALLAKCEPFLGVTGKLQVQDGVVHLVAKKLWVPKLEVRPVGGGSRDFH